MAVQNLLNSILMVPFLYSSGFISAGKVYFEVKKGNSLYGRNILKIVSSTRTSSFFDAIYKMRDIITSYIDEKGLFTWKYLKIQRDGSKKMNSAFNYLYQDNYIGRYRAEFKKGEVSSHSEKIKINDFVRDPFSAIYYIRALNFKVGDVFSFTAHSSSSTYEVKVIIEKIETVRVPAGKFRCYKIKPLALKEGVLQEKGSMEIWLTVDKFKMPVKIRSKLAIGSITSKLYEFKL